MACQHETQVGSRVFLPPEHSGLPGPSICAGGEGKGPFVRRNTGSVRQDDVVHFAATWRDAEWILLSEVRRRTSEAERSHIRGL